MATATSETQQRKSFFDSVNNRHWTFYYNGSAIEYSYSVDGSSWSSAGTLAYDTSNFSVVFKDIGGTGYVFLAAKDSTYDVVVRRGTLSATAITFAAAQTVFDGTSVSNNFTKPTVAISANGHLWVSAIKDSGGLNERYQAQVRRSTNLADGDLSSFNAITPVGAGNSQLANTVIMPKAGDEMYLLTSTGGSKIVGYTYDGTSWSSANGGGDYSWFGFGRSGLNTRYNVVNEVYAIGILNGDVYVAGTFTDAGGIPEADNIARWDGTNWNALGSGLNNIVYSMEIVGSDIYLGGSFQNAGGDANADRIVRWDGTSYNAIGTGVTNDVYAIAVSGSDVYIGGSFNDAGGIAAADKIARWDGASWNALGSGLTNSVRAIEISGSDVYVGGQFVDAGGIAAADYIARWDGANWNAMGTGATGTIWTIAIDGSDVYIGGDFGAVSGVGSTSGIARWDGANWNPLGSGLGQVRALVISGSDLYAGGLFNNAGGVADADKVARWDGANWNALDTGTNNTVWSLAITGSDVYVGGVFGDVGGIGADRIARWDGAAWNSLDSGGVVGRVYAIAISGSNVYIAGEFINAGGVIGADKVARWDGSNWNAMGGGLGTGTSIKIYALATSGNDVYVGGAFTDAGGIAAADYIARWDGTSWNSMGTGATGPVRAIAVSGSDVYVAGAFGSTSGVANTLRIARWDGANWNALGTGLANQVDALAVVGSDVYAAGYFLNAGGDGNADYIARWDGANWNALGATPLTDVVHALAVMGSDLYVGGNFNNAGGDAAADRIAKWNGTTWSGLGSGLNHNVFAIAIAGSNLYAGGQFTDAGGDASADYLAQWDGATWSALGNGITGSVVDAVAASSDTVYFAAPNQNIVGTNKYEYVGYYTAAIATDAQSSTELSAVSNTSGDIFLTYTDSSGNVKFRAFDDGSSQWATPVVLNAAASSAPNISLNPNTSTLIASWIDSNAVTAVAGDSPYGAGDWNTKEPLYAIGTNAELSTPFLTAVDNVRALWTSGNSNPYDVRSSLSALGPPTVVISSSEISPSNAATIPVTIQFNEDVTGFVIGDITVGNGSAANFVTVDAATYTVEITPAANGAVTVDVAGSVAQDVVANNNLPATQFSIVSDTTAPGITISSSSTATTNTSPIPVTFQFTETVTGFVVGDITVANATIGNFLAVDGDTYTADLTPTAQGLVTVDVAVTVAQDSAGNGNTAAAQLSRLYDSGAPTVTISSSATSPTSTNPIPVTFQFNETVTGFSLEDITVTNGTAGGFVAVDGDTYTATVTPSGAGSVTVLLAAGVCQDSVGNVNAVSATFAITYENSDIDSDNDGISDEQEEAEGTNPNDAGSIRDKPPVSWCSEWNGFFGMYNVSEYLNADTEDHSIVSTLYDVEGVEESMNEFSIKAQRRQDVLVHDMPGWAFNSYGRVCSSVVDGAEGNVDGSLVFYKPNSSGMDFAMGFPNSGGFKGSQFVTFNTYQPSLNYGEQENTVVNWLQITNLGDALANGSLIVYGQDGSVIDTKELSIPGKNVRYVPGHLFGESIVGLVEWRPQDSTASFILRNIRYYYDNSVFENSFASAMQHPGMKGNGELLDVTLDTRGQTVVLEVANVKDSPISVNIKFYDESGSRLKTRELRLPAYSSEHIIVNSIDDPILENSSGSATINGNTTESVVAIAMHYGRTESLGISSVYGTLARQPLGTTLYGSYNTYLEQGCTLLLSNILAKSVDVSVDMRRLDQTPVLVDHIITVPGKGTAVYDLCGAEEANQYGKVSVTSSTAHSILPVILRIGKNDDYRFPTHMR